MVSEGERPKSSWQSWVRASQRERAAARAEAPPGPEPVAPPVEPEPWPTEAEVEPTATTDVDAADEGFDNGFDLDDAAVTDDEGEDDLDLEEADDLDEIDEIDEIDNDDDPGDAAFDDGDDADEGDDDDAAYGELLPTVPLLPSIAGRVEALSGVLRSISHRVDGLSAATDVYRSTMVDRIDEFTETVLDQGRRADASLDEYRRTTERTIAELRRRISEQADSSARLLGRVEEVATDVTTLVTGQPAADDGSLATELGGLTQGLTQNEQVLAGLQASLDVLINQQAGLGREVVAMREAAATAPAPVVAPEAATDPALLERLTAIEEVAVEVAGAVRRMVAGQEATAHAIDDMRALVELVVDTMPASAEGSGIDLVAALNDLRGSVDRAGKASAKAPAKAAAAADDAAVASIAEAVVNQLDLDALAALVAEHLSASFEVVDGGQLTAAPPDAADPPAAKRSRRR